MNVCSRVISALRSVLCSGQTALDLGVHLSDHLCQLKDELVLILALVAFAVRICHELLLEEIIVAFLARSNVCLRVREQVVRAEGQQVEFANLRHNKSEINNVFLKRKLGYLTSLSSKWSLRARRTKRGLFLSLPISWSSSCLMWSILRVFKPTYPTISTYY